MKRLRSTCLFVLISLLFSYQSAKSQVVSDPYADRVVIFTAGNPASECCNDPKRALGAPDFNPDSLTGFVTLGVGGSITLEFVNNLAINGDGPDLQILGDPASDEKWFVEVSEDGQNYISFGLVNEFTSLDFAQLGLSMVRFVRITDDGSPIAGVSPGAELDAIQALFSSELGSLAQPQAVPTTTTLPIADTSATGSSPLIDQTWVRLGGPLGGLGYDIRMRPDNPNILYVTDAWAGVHVSNDAGLTWSPSNQGISGRAGDSGDAIPVFSLTIDPNNNDIIWAGLQFQRGIYKSIDAGISWQRLDQGVVETDITFRGFTIQPGASNVVYAAGEISSWEWAGEEIHGLPFDLTKGVVYRTMDGGMHWQAIWRGDDLARYVWVNPNNTDIIYISTGIFDREAANSDPISMRQKGVAVPGGVGIYKSIDGGKTWSQVNQGLHNLYVGSLFMHPTNPDILLAGAGNNTYPEGSGIYLTNNGGENWQLVQDSQKSAITSVEFSQSDPQIVYAGGGQLFYRSQDGGLTWEHIVRENGRWGPIGVNPGSPIDFQVDLKNPRRIFANNYGGGNFLSEDGGETWVSASTGYTGADIRGLTIHPQNPAIVYANGRSGPFLSTDGGIHWQGINPEDLPCIVEGSIISIDPQNPQNVLMTESNSTRILWSDDAGKQWQESNYERITTYEEIGLEIGLGGLEALSYSPAKPGRIYGAYGHNACRADGQPCESPIQFSVIISEDGGRTWQRSLNVPQDGLPATAILTHPNNPDIAWLSMPELGMLRTLDGGKTWQPFAQSLTPQKVMSLAHEPGNDEVLYAGTLSGGIYRSQDGGENWQPSSVGMDANEPIFAIAVDPVRNNVLYAASARSGVYISQDGGQTWVKNTNGLRTRAIHVLAISSDGNTLFAGTRGEGVFRLSTLNQTQFDALKPAATSTPFSTPTSPIPTVAAPSTQTIPSTEEPKGSTLPCGSTMLLPIGVWLLVKSQKCE